jgi:hypothetical protein
VSFGKRRGSASTHLSNVWSIVREIAAATNIAARAVDEVLRGQRPADPRPPVLVVESSDKDGQAIANLDRLDRRQGIPHDVKRRSQDRKSTPFICGARSPTHRGEPLMSFAMCCVKYPGSGQAGPRKPPLQPS